MASSAAPPSSPPADAPALTAPANQSWAAILARAQTRLQTPNLGGYTIQLAALPSNTSAAPYMRLVAAQLDESKVYAQYSVYKDKTYMAVYFGDFDSFNAAALAVQGLPAAMKVNRPLVRTWIKIKEDQAP